MRAVVKNVVWKSKDVVSLDLSLEAPLNALPGQFVLVALPGYEQRAYSIVSEMGSLITLGVKVELNTSKALSELKINDSFNVFGPFGTFIPRVGEKVVLVGGGIGVTPLISLYKHCKKEGIPVAVLLSSKGDFVFVENFSSPKLFNTTKGRRINENDISKDSLVYICGPNAMVDSLRDALIVDGHNPNKIYSEDFS